MSIVTIDVDTTAGTIKVTPHRVHVHRGDELRWAITEEADAATISFPNASPFDGNVLRSASHPPTIASWVSTSAPPGDYKYGVGVSVRGTLYVEDDPYIFVI